MAWGFEPLVLVEGFEPLVLVEVKLNTNHNIQATNPNHSLEGSCIMGDSVNISNSQPQKMGGRVGGAEEKTRAPTGG